MTSSRYVVSRFKLYIMISMESFLLSCLTFGEINNANCRPPTSCAIFKYHRTKIHTFAMIHHRFQCESNRQKKTSSSSCSNIISNGNIITSPPTRMNCIVTNSLLSLYVIHAHFFPCQFSQPRPETSTAMYFVINQYVWFEKKVKEQTEWLRVALKNGTHPMG